MTPLTTDKQVAGEPQQNPSDGPWSMSFDSIMEATGRAVDTVKQAATEVSESTSKLKIWEMPFEEIKKLIPSRTTKTEEQAPVAPSKAVAEPIKQGIYHTPERLTPDLQKLKKLYDEKLLNVESRLKHYKEDGKTLTTSPRGALGISQIMPETGAKPGYGIKPLQDQSEEEYRRLGFDLLAAYQKKYKGDVRKALAAYNYGPGNVDKAIVQARKAKTNWETRLPKETRDYLTKIVGRANG